MKGFKAKMIRMMTSNTIYGWRDLSHTFPSKIYPRMYSSNVCSVINPTPDKGTYIYVLISVPLRICIFRFCGICRYCLTPYINFS